jgi:hypothetical protein
VKKWVILISVVAGIEYGALVSCIKEYSCENCNENKSPIANAGPDQTIRVPVDSVIIDGSASRDPDGTIVSFQWTKISGPSAFTIKNAASAKTVVKGLVVGSYQFELKVTDNKGLYAKDTMQVMVNDPAQPNRPPVANAGPDQTIFFPQNFADLDGIRSTDPDNNIASYLWTKIAGPSVYSIVDRNAVQTRVNNLQLDIYYFELKVTDSKGLFSKDTVIITVLPQAITCNLSLTPVAILSEARNGITTASANNKLLFAGGIPYSNGTGSKVDIYDLSSQSWTTAELSIPRSFLSVAVSGDKIFFAGGQYESSRIDIYDAGNNTWSTDELQEAKSDLVVASVGGKVFFAGGMNNGNYSNTVEIYDIATNSWTYAQLSEARHSIVATTYGNKIFFSGGQNASGSPSRKVDIYDAFSDSWSTATMSEPKSGHCGIGAAGKIFWAGGLNGGANCSLQVQMYDPDSGNSSFHVFSQTSCYPKAGISNNRIVFFTQEGGIKVEVYDMATQTWSFCNLLYNSLKAVANANNNVYCVAVTSLNGEIACQVLKLQ